MRRRQLITTAIAAAAMLSVTACSSFPSFGGSKKKDEEDKAGRVTMVLADEALTASPDLADTAITLDDARVIEAWTQAGANAQKLVGHVAAADSLRVAWRTNVGKGSNNKSAVTTPPVSDGTLVFTMDADQTIYATNLSSGRVEWRKELKGLTKRDKTVLGGGLAVEGDKLVVASGFGYVTALDKSNGGEIWKETFTAPMTGAPTIKDGRIFVSSNNNEIFALSLETGQVEWSDQAISETARVLGSSSPAAVEDFVIAPYSSGEIIAYLASNGRRLWTDAISQAGRFTPISEINDIGARPVLAGGLVFASSQSGITIAIDGRSGNRVWTDPIGSTQAPAIAGNALFLIGTDDTLAAIDASTGKAFWVTEMPRWKKPKKKKGRISYAGPIVASDRVIVVSSTGMLTAYSPQTGEEVGSMKLGDTVFIEPIAVQDKILVLTDDAKLIAIE